MSRREHKLPHGAYARARDGTALVLAFTLVALSPSVAAGQPSPPHDLELRVSGSCPDEAAVRAVLQSLAPLAAADTAPSISDHRSFYVVTVGALSKTYGDPQRDCAHRARVAAAFISLALVPDALPDASVPAPGSAPAPTPAPAPPPALRVLFDARATGEGAFTPGLFAPGVVLDGAVMRGAFGVQMGCGWESSASLAAAGADVLVERFPCALGPRLRVSPDGSTVEVGVTASVVAGLLHVRGAGFATDYDATRLEVAARVAVDFLFRVSGGARMAPLLGVQATYEPYPYDLDASSRGVIGHTPSWWLGGSAGVSLDIP